MNKILLHSAIALPSVYQRSLTQNIVVVEKPVENFGYFEMV
jgi:hypothetical protein